MNSLARNVSLARRCVELIRIEIILVNVSADQSEFVLALHFISVQPRYLHSELPAAVLDLDSAESFLYIYFERARRLSFGSMEINLPAPVIIFPLRIVLRLLRDFHAKSGDFERTMKRYLRL
jgi:hypothetical protein